MAGTATLSVVESYDVVTVPPLNLSSLPSCASNARLRQSPDKASWLPEHIYAVRLRFRVAVSGVHPTAFRQDPAFPPRRV